MAANFQLYWKGRTEPELLSVVDDAMCYHFRVERDDQRYHSAWYDILGFKLAMGKSFDQIDAYLSERLAEAKTIMNRTHRDENVADYLHLIEINYWLEKNFTVNSWTTVGRG